MNARALAAVGAALIAAFLLMREIGGGPPPPAPSPRARAARPARAASARPPASTRNVFEFGPRPVAAAAPRPAGTVVVPEAPVIAEPPAAAPAVRFVGLVRRGGALKAALQVHGEPVVLGKGESAGGYRVVAIDEDGVRLEAADGTILTLSAGGS